MLTPSTSNPPLAEIQPLGPSSRGILAALRALEQGSEN